jgi:hypothetical protein
MEHFMNDFVSVGIISSQELDELRRSTRHGMPHPVVALSDQSLVNTISAARLIFAKNPSWLSTVKPRLLDSSDFTNASSALGEIRAYGALLETWMSVTPHPAVPGRKVIPEFEVNGSDDKVIVEVHSRQLDKEQLEAIGKHHEELMSTHNTALERHDAKSQAEAVVTFSELDVTPMGAPNPHKTGDSVLTNVISRIASIKQYEKQLDPEKPFLLWLDLQDPTVWSLPIAEQQLSPLYTENKDGEVGSGALWFALYGRKNDVMVESQCFEYKIVTMLHDGRFAQTSLVSAVIYSLPRATVLMENPSPTKSLSPKFRASLLKLPFFRLDLSVVDWEPGLVKSRMELEWTTIEAAAKSLQNFNL